MEHEYCKEADIEDCDREETPAPCGQPLNDLLVCAKCSGTNIRVRWHKNNYRIIGEKLCGKYDEAQLKGEHLHYYCGTCLFDWAGEIGSAK